ncbi:DNA polymerase I-3'-5' exonuclease and polymerase domain protein [Burkholderia pseudomallei]|nr:DNA polymerase I-3'-5' exonuclease and polymerase domain protein [Burkholderia pseudomallei]
MSASSAAYSDACASGTSSKPICCAPLPATSSYLIVFTPRWRSARLSMSCVRCDSSTYDSSSVSCSMPFSAMP